MPCTVWAGFKNVSVSESHWCQTASFPQATPEPMARVIRSPSWTPGRRTLELGNVLQDFQHLSALSFAFWSVIAVILEIYIPAHVNLMDLHWFNVYSENRCWYDDVSVHLPWQCLDVWYRIQICSTILFFFNNLIELCDYLGCDEHWALEELDLHVPEELMHQADMFNIPFGHTCQVLTIPNAPVSCFDVCQGSSRSKVFIVFTALLSVFQGQTPESPQSEESPVPANRQAQNQAESTKSLISTCRTIDEICENALPPDSPYQIIFLPAFCLLSWRTLR